MRRIAGLLLAAVLAVSLVAAKKNEGQGKGKGKGKSEAGAAVSGVRFDSAEVRVIRDYYGAHPVSLPPGLQKKLARGKPLPPGWQKKLAPFPAQVETRLPPPCGYCGRGVIDGYAVVYDKRTRILLDVVQLVADIVSPR